MNQENDPPQQLPSVMSEDILKNVCNNNTKSRYVFCIKTDLINRSLLLFSKIFLRYTTDGNYHFTRQRTKPIE